MVIFRIQKKREYENKNETEISNFDMLFFFFMGRPSPPDLFTSRFAHHTLRFVQNLSYKQISCRTPNRRDGHCIHSSSHHAIQGRRSFLCFHGPSLLIHKWALCVTAFVCSLHTRIFQKSCKDKVNEIRPWHYFLKYSLTYASIPNTDTYGSKFIKDKRR